MHILDHWCLHFDNLTPSKKKVPPAGIVRNSLTNQGKEGRACVIRRIKSVKNDDTLSPSDQIGDGYFFVLGNLNNAEKCRKSIEYPMIKVFGTGGGGCGGRRGVYGPGVNPSGKISADREGANGELYL